jgi:hypothetical protein
MNTAKLLEKNLAGFEAERPVLFLDAIIEAFS